MYAHQQRNTTQDRHHPRIDIHETLRAYKIGALLSPVLLEEDGRGEVLLCRGEFARVDDGCA